MDDPSDFLDLFDFLSDSINSGAFDHGGVDALAALLEGADYTSFGIEVVHAVSEIDPSSTEFWADPGGDIFADFDPLEWNGFEPDTGEFLAETAPITSSDFLGAGADLGELPDWGGDVDPMVVQEQIHSAFESVPPAFTAGLNVDDINWDPSLHPENPETVGRCNSSYSGEGGAISSIELYDHAEEVIPTLHHEIGHHIALSHPRFFGEFTIAMSGEEAFFDHQSDFLSQYELSKQPGEVFAQAISFYTTQPEILQELAPKAFEVIDKWYSAAAAV